MDAGSDDDVSVGGHGFHICDDGKVGHDDFGGGDEGGCCGWFFLCGEGDGDGFADAGAEAFDEGDDFCFGG